MWLVLRDGFSNSGTHGNNIYDWIDNIRLKTANVEIENEWNKRVSMFCTVVN